MLETQRYQQVCHVQHLHPSLIEVQPMPLPNCVDTLLTIDLAFLPHLVHKEEKSSKYIIDLPKPKE